MAFNKEEYRQSLQDLKMNSKPQINVLTMMAEDYMKNASEVVDVITEHANRVPQQVKLPVLYLIDSIMKNVGKIYPSLFEKYIVNTFFSVFDKADDKTRAAMFKLRQTWNVLFNLRTLYTIDVKCHSKDNKWPIVQLPPNTSSSIHVNPKFLNTSKGNSVATVANKANPVSNSVSNKSKDPEEIMRATLLLKQKELLEVQQQKIELELRHLEQAALDAKLKGNKGGTEAAKSQEKMLLEQAERAKTKTTIAHQIMTSLSPSQSSQKPFVASEVVVPSKSSPKTVRKEKEQDNKSKSIDKDKRSTSKDKGNKRSDSKGRKEDEKKSPSSSSGSQKSSKSPKQEHSDETDPYCSGSRSRSRSSSKSNTSSRLRKSEHDSTTVLKSEKKKKHSSDKRSRSRSGSRSKDSKDRKRKSMDRGKDKSSSPSKGSRSPATPKAQDHDNFESRKSAVLKRRYRKDAVPPSEVEENKAPQNTSPMEITDVDLRFPALKSEPAMKKPRTGIVDLFGIEDVDLRQASAGVGGGSWSQVKKERLTLDEDELLQHPSRPSSATLPRGGCDPLGRPLLYNQLPDDPEERKRSLDSRAQAVDPVDKFRQDFIEKAINEKGEISPVDVKNIMAKAHEILSPEQYVTVMKQMQQINEASAMREVQQMQMQVQDVNWQDQQPRVNPWNGMKPSTQQDTVLPWIKPSVIAVAQGPTPWGPPTFQSSMPGPQGVWASDMPTNRWSALLPTPPLGPNPFEEALGAAIDDFLPPTNEMELRTAERDKAASIPIDKIMRQVRFYGDTAVILLGEMGDDPRQISFKRDNHPRTVVVDGKPIEVMIGEAKRFELNRRHYTLKIGAPTRELYIDDRHYEAFFDGPAIKIPINNQLHTFQLVGKPPDVEIGKIPRYDLIAGKVTLVVDAVHQLVVFLDEKPQKIDIFRKPITLKFTGGFNTVLLNGRPFATNFGNRLPFSVTPPNETKHYLRFSALPPSTVNAIRQFIRKRQEQLDNETGRGGRRGKGRRRGGARDPEPIVPLMSLSNQNQNPLDMLNFLTPTQPTDIDDERRLCRARESFHSYESEFKDAGGDNKGDSAGSGGNGLPDVTNLLAMAEKLGLLPSNTKEKEENNKKNPAQESDEQEAKEEKKPTPLPTVDLFITNKNWGSGRRPILIDQLWTGEQCGSCGLRFPPDQTLKYPLHLDWHFRKNRREKTEAKKPKSRTWYYTLSDWIQFQEVEDIEQRAASLFELQEDRDGEGKSPITEIPDECTLPELSHKGAVCPHCGEGFESYWDETEEEYRLKNAKIGEAEGEEKVFHTLCHQDYLNSLVDETMQIDQQDDDKAESITIDIQVEKMEEQEQEASAPGEPSPPPPDTPTPQSLSSPPPPSPEDDDEVLILKEGKKEVVLMEIDVVDDEEGKKDELNNEPKNKTVELNGLTTSPEKKSKEGDDNDSISTENPAPNYTIFRNDVDSPIVVNDDSSSNVLPGISEDSSVGVFTFALGIGREGSDSPVAIDEKKIVYKSMEFDFPRIKIEPPDDDVPEDDLDTAPAIPEGEEVGEGDVPAPVIVEPPVGTNADEPIDLTADDDNSVEPYKPALHQTTSIEGNVHVDDTVPILIMAPTKIKINLDLSGKSPKSPGESSAKSPKPDEISEASQTPSLSSLIPNPNTPELKSPLSPNETEPELKSPESISDSSNAEIVFTEELKRLKPRLAGRKMTNYPPKQGNKEESGLCVIS